MAVQEFRAAPVPVKATWKGRLRLETQGRKRIFVGGDLQSKNLNFADLGLLVGAPGATTGDHPVSDTQKQMEKKQEASGRILPDTPLNLDEVRNAVADVTFKGVHIDAQSLPLDNLDLHLKLDDALLMLTPLKVGVAGGQVNSSIVIDARSDTVATDYDIRFSKFRIAEFFKSAGFPEGGTGDLDGRIRLHGTGNSVRTSLASANGQASAVVDNGCRWISDLAANILGLDVAKALGVLITGDKKVPLNCLIADFEVKDGQMTPRTFVLDTDAAVTHRKRHDQPEGRASGP